MNHELKTWPEIFRAMWEGRKCFDIRRNDRGFKVLDGIVLREYEPKDRTYSGRWLSGVVTFLVPGGAWGLPADLCVMQLSLVSRGETEQDPGTLARELWAKWAASDRETRLPPADSSAVPEGGREASRVLVGGKAYRTVVDAHGVRRFPGNDVVRLLFTRGRIDLNALLVAFQDGAFPQRDYAEFYMALGCSVSAFKEVSAFKDMTVEDAEDAPLHMHP